MHPSILQCYGYNLSYGSSEWRCLCAAGDISPKFCQRADHQFIYLVTVYPFFLFKVILLDQGSHASINDWECYEIWEKKIPGLEMLWKFADCPGNLQIVLEILQNVLEKSSVLEFF